MWECPPHKVFIFHNNIKLEVNATFDGRFLQIQFCLFRRFHVLFSAKETQKTSELITEPNLSLDPHFFSNAGEVRIFNGGEEVGGQRAADVNRFQFVSYVLLWGSGVEPSWFYPCVLLRYCMKAKWRSWLFYNIIIQQSWISVSTETAASLFTWSISFCRLCTLYEVYGD